MAFIDYFKEQVIENQIPELQPFTRTPNRWLPKIINYYGCNNITNGPIRSFNHKIKDVKRHAYGFRNERKFEFCAWEILIF